MSHIRKRLELGESRLALVPVPASEVDRSTLEATRWPARELARELQLRGVGTVRLCIANRVPVKPKHEVSRTATAIASNLIRIDDVPRDEVVVYVDDLITWGATIAAADHVLQPVTNVCAMAIAFTDSTPMDAYKARRRLIDYCVANDDLSVEIRDPEGQR
jgi:predicted amidophosphoribosyltransferase